MNLFKLAAKTLAILGLLIVNNLVSASPLNITSADPSDDPSDEPYGNPDNPMDNPYYRCDPGRGRGQFSPNYYSEPPWPKQNPKVIFDTTSGFRNEWWYGESRDINMTNSTDLLYCLSDMYHGIHKEEPGISDEEHHRRLGKEGYKKEGWYCRGNYFELGFKGIRFKWPAWKVVEACRGHITQAAIAGRPWVNCQLYTHTARVSFHTWFGWSPAQCKMRFKRWPECYIYSEDRDKIKGNPKYNSCMHPPCPEMCPKGVGMKPTSQPTSSAKRYAESTSKPTSKPAPEPEYPKPTPEPGGQKPALEPVCTNYCGGLSKAYNDTNNVLDRKEELDNFPAEEA